ncbi:MAG: LemA family protein [Candidatus Peregrinibacteria bacterium]|nr:LemA family protein [Candidatus Peregrinibacteria bacterium]MDZ4244346.1 LemA family protein [Candidatus Gracilibacteria bacterium]
MTPLIILLVIVGLLILFIIGSYNGLVRARLHTEEAYSGMDVQLKRRYDMIPNLVEIVKGYAAHEKEILIKVTEARSNAMNAQGVANKAGAENALSGALKSLFAVAENYPDLKANTNFLKLQEEYAIVEDAIQGSRRMFNSAVKSLNIKVETFPSNMIAGMFGFKKKEFFEADESARENIKIEM